MPLYQVSTGVFINANDVNQVVNVLYRPTGQQETGKYFLTSNASASSQAFGDYVGSISRGSTPSGSVSIDTSDQTPSNCASPTADHLSANGFRVFSTSTGSANTVVCGGAYTITY
jgi:hypothetical protein